MQFEKIVEIYSPAILVDDAVSSITRGFKKSIRIA